MLHHNLRLPGQAGRWCFRHHGDGRIHDLQPQVQPPPPLPAAATDWQGDWLSPPGVDLQINGLRGLAFPQLTTADLPALHQALRWLRQQGVGAVSPTLITSAVPAVHNSLAVLRQAREQQQAEETQLLGAHLEGPFLAPARRGAHPAAHLQPLELPRLQALLGPFTADVAIVTLAPELDPQQQCLQWLVAQGIVVSVGHTRATEAEARQAFAAGARMVTHAFNAMAPLLHRVPGVVGAACLASEPVVLGLIADGNHVAPTAAALLARMAPGRLALVSDVLAPYGLKDGAYGWDERRITVNNGCCRLEDGTLAGSTVGLLSGTTRLARWTRDPELAIAATTLQPRACTGAVADAAVLLRGQPLRQQLRWHWNAQQDRLRWEFAAGPPGDTPNADTPDA